MTGIIAYMGIAVVVSLAIAVRDPKKKPTHQNSDPILTSIVQPLKGISVCCGDITTGITHGPAPQMKLLSATINDSYPGGSV